MSNIHCKEEYDAKRTQQAALPPSPSRGVSASSRPVMERTRLFKSHLNCIIKDKRKSREKGVGEASPKAGLHIKDDVIDTSLKVEPEESPHFEADFHLLDREEPSGAEGDDCEDLLETPVVKREGCSETIVIEFKREVSDLSPISSADNMDSSVHSDDVIEAEELSLQQAPQNSDLSSSDHDESKSTAPVKMSKKLKKRSHRKRMQNTEATSHKSQASEFSKENKANCERSKTKNPPSVKHDLSGILKRKSKSRDVARAEKITSNETPNAESKCSSQHRSRKSSTRTLRHVSGSASPTKYVCDRSPSRQSRNSVSPTTHQCRDSSVKKSRHSSKSTSPSGHQQSDCSKKKSTLDSQFVEKEKSNSSKRERSQSRSGRTTSEDVKASHSFHEESPHTFAPHYKQKTVQLLGYDPDYSCPSSDNVTPIKSTHRMTAGQQLAALNPLSKLSSSETYVDVAASSASEDDTIDHEICTVPNQHKMATYASFSSRCDSGHSRSSYTQNFIPLVDTASPYVSLRPEMHHMPPSPLTSYSSHSSPNCSLISGFPSPLLVPSYFARPPPPPPPMQEGVFKWSTNVETSSSPVPRQPSPTVATPPPQPAAQSIFAPSQSVDRRFQCLQNLHHPPKPSFHGYQLIGDSMLLRFSQQMLGESAHFAESLRFLGYCVSGQRIGELLKRLRSGFYHVGKRVILMIGTNDLLRNTQVEQMCHELHRVVEHLRNAAEEVVVMTLPPVPRLENQTCHWLRLNHYNDFIRTLGTKDSGISVFDLSPLYTLTQEELEEERLVADFNTSTPFCHGCLTCVEDSEDFGWDSSQSDEDDFDETSFLTRVFISTTPPPVTALDICKEFVDKRIHRCRMDCFEMRFSESGRKDLIHLNFKGLTVVKEELFKVL